jgi:4-phytase/acid phosphatase
LGKPGDRLLLLIGHDANISHISSLLNLSWLLPGYQRDDTPPGGALVFRLWHGPGKAYSVETLYIAETLNQMRDTAPLGRDSGPPIARIFVPGCSGSDGRFDCGWDGFWQVVLKAVDSRYISQP